MSDVAEKTLASLPDLIASRLGIDGSAADGSRHFKTFVQRVGELKNKFEEEQFIQKELSVQKTRLSQPRIQLFQIRESLLRVIYCQMLGYDVSFAYIHSLKMTQQGNTILEKRAGYLACCLLIPKDHELLLLLTSTLQKDLISSSILDNLSALTAIPYLIRSDMVPLLMPAVLDNARHQKDIIRKKSLICLHHFMNCARDMVLANGNVFVQALSDQSPSVLQVTVGALWDLVQDNPASHQDLLPRLLGILHQIVNRKLTLEHDFHTVPAPWLTIGLLKLLAKLGAGNPSASHDMYPVLKEVLEKTETTHKMGLAVIHECLLTVARIEPHDALLQHVANCVSRFLSARNLNLRYLGLKVLVEIVAVHPRYAAAHQNVVLECLDHPDSALRRKSLKLLYHMANVENNNVICQRMLQCIPSALDVHSRMDIVAMLMELNHKHAPDLVAYVQSMLQVLQIAGDVVPSNARDRMLSHIQKGCSNEDTALQQQLVSIFWTTLNVLKSNKVSDLILSTGAWVLGEFCLPDGKVPPESAMALLISLLPTTKCVSTQCLLISALQKLVVHVQNPLRVWEQISGLEDYNHDNGHKDLQERLNELKGLCSCLQNQTNRNLQRELGSCKGATDMDLTLSFLDDYVSQGLEGGGKPYRPFSHRQASTVNMLKPKNINDLNFEKEKTASTASNDAETSFPAMVDNSSDSSFGLGRDSGSGLWTSCNTGDTSLKEKVHHRVWGKDGLIASQQNETSSDSLKDELAIKQPPSPCSATMTPASIFSVGQEQVYGDGEQMKHAASVTDPGISLDMRQEPQDQVQHMPPTQNTCTGKLLGAWNERDHDDTESHGLESQKTLYQLEKPLETEPSGNVLTSLYTPGKAGDMYSPGNEIFPLPRFSQMDLVGDASAMSASLPSRFLPPGPAIDSPKSTSNLSMRIPNQEHSAASDREYVSMYDTWTSMVPHATSSSAVSVVVPDQQRLRSAPSSPDSLLEPVLPGVRSKHESLSLHDSMDEDSIDGGFSDTGEKPSS